MKIKLSEHFTYHKLLRFVFPSIVMMIFTSIYGVVDGLFCVQLCRKDSVCRNQPHYAVYYGTLRPWFHGRNRWQCHCGKNFGEGKEKDTNRYFSMLIYLTIFGGIVLSILEFYLQDRLASHLAPPETF